MQRWVLVERSVEFVHVRLVMLAIMYLHRLRIKVRLECVESVGECGECVSHEGVGESGSEINTVDEFSIIFLRLIVECDMTQVNASMNIRILKTPAELQTYDAWVRGHAQGNLWQSLEWKTYQESLGRKVQIYAYVRDNSTIEASALVVIDTTAGGFSTWDIPRGPLFTTATDDAPLLSRIIDDAKRKKCLALYLSPALPIIHSSATFVHSSRHVQPEATRVIDLTQSEDTILSQMHSKGRYNITLAKKHGIEVMEGTSNDIPAFYELLQSTGGRDGFKISQKSHYERFLSGLEGSFLLLAKHEIRPIAGLLGVVWPSTQVNKRGADFGSVGGTPAGVPDILSKAKNGGVGLGGPSANCFYYYGASSYEHRNLMAPYLLQWEAIRRAKARGCTRYDLLGISPENAGPHDPWQGISDFKRKFGGTIVSYPPEQMIVLKPMMKRLLEVKRKLLG